MDKRFEFWSEKWNELQDREKLQLYQDYCRDCEPDNLLFDFGEEFFETFFANDVMSAVRAVHFGNIQLWNDEYIKFNGYGNLVSISTYQAVELANDCMYNIYDHDRFQEYIDMDEYDYPEDEENEEEEEG